MNLIVGLKKRDFSDPVGFPDLQFSPQRYGWAALGGPDFAEIAVAGEARGLWSLLNWLRAPVEITDERDVPVWWGYVDEIVVQVGAIEVGVSLRYMVNRVAVTYSYVPPGSSTVGTRATTGWVQDDDSVATYGTKELLDSRDGATAAAAEARRDAILARLKYPIPTARVLGGAETLEARLLCRGWWSTLDWTYYTNSGTASVETSTQIDTIVTAEGAFFSGVDLVDASGISSSEYQEGDATALRVIRQLLEDGSSNDQRLLATVTRDRVLKVYEEPGSDEVTLYLPADGRPQDGWGNEVLAHTCPVAQWCELKDVIPATVDSGVLAAPSPFFVERAEFDVRRQLWIPEPRGIPSPWEIGELVDG
ncbi:MAG: hypothetical protein ACLFU8_06170 [Anaerolineales bacterium]